MTIRKREKSPHPGVQPPIEHSKKTKLSLELKAPMVSDNSNDIICYHPSFNDPAAEVILVSKEGVRFRLSSWHMSRKSSFIKDLLKVPSTTKLSDAPIEIAATECHLLQFAELVYSHKENLPPLSTASDLQSLLQICEQLQCEGLQQAVYTALRNRAVSESWEVFRFAASRNDIELGRHAIRVFGKISPSKLKPITTEELLSEPALSIPNGFAREILKLRLGPVIRMRELETGEIVMGHSLVPWGKVAEDFFVVRTTSEKRMGAVISGTRL